MTFYDFFSFFICLAISSNVPSYWPEKSYSYTDNKGSSRNRDNIYHTYTSESFCIERIFFFEGMIFKDKDKIIIRERNTKQITILIDVSPT